MTPARTGAAARSQELTSYDNGTRTYTGTKSRVRFTVTPASGELNITGTYVFLVTPTGPEDPYRLTVVTDYAPEFPTTEVTLNYPWIVGASVYLERWTFSYTQSVSDDFSSYSLGEHLENLPASESWSEPVQFACPPPNTDVFADFENEQLGPAATVVTGYGWVSAGELYAGDPLDCLDEFETYDVGSIEILYGGVGFAAPGYMVDVDTPHAYDDFETYSTGSITVLNAGSGWDADGVIA